MRVFKVLMIAALLVGLGNMAYAELQNVEVGGSIRIRGNWYDFDDDVETAFYEQRTRLSVKADFTDEVSAFIELDSYNHWGSDFRSNYITGFDTVSHHAPAIIGGTNDDVQLYQAYIEANEMWGTPLRLRVGRQELSFGSEWLVGVNNASSLFTGLSFDAIRLTYATDQFSIDAWSAKLNETHDDFGDSDVDFYGIYASYLGLEDIVIDGYWMYVRDDESLTAFDVDLHTIGLRGAGTVGAFDFEAEIAYQFGEADAGRGADADIDAFGANLEAGYTFDMNYQPRIYLGFAYLEGGEQGGRRGLFRRSTPDLSFNRLFSNWEYTEFFANTDESNLFIYRGGVSVQPTESLELALAAAYFEADETRPGRRFLWWSESRDDSIGWELGLYATYNYSEDLAFRAGFAHFFGGDGLEDGNRIILNGLGAYTDDDDDDYNYLFVETEISF